MLLLQNSTGCFLMNVFSFGSLAGSAPQVMSIVLVEDFLEISSVLNFVVHDCIAERMQLFFADIIVTS